MLYVTCPDAASHGRTFKYVTSWSELSQPGSAQLVGLGLSEVVWQYSVEELTRVAAEAGFKVRRFGYTASSFGRHINVALVKG